MEEHPTFNFFAILDLSRNRALKWIPLLFIHFNVFRALCFYAVKGIQSIEVAEDQESFFSWLLSLSEPYAASASNALTLT
mmetsp:Transcript_7964/g.12083  ORF Transcript_7964/g.12083 Transcript_7964/m.12083 type:complete len:80 (-) Transcript_7964:1055-1294(-)